jgi:hypothetical protein
MVGHGEFQAKAAEGRVKRRGIGCCVKCGVIYNRQIEFINFNQIPFEFWAYRIFQGPVVLIRILIWRILGYISGLRNKFNFLSDLLILCHNHQTRAQSLKVYQLLMCLILFIECTVFR